MKYKSKFIYLIFLSILTSLTAAQTIPAPNGTTIRVAAYGEVKRVNDEAYLFFSTEEEDREETIAASRVNQKMKEAIALIKRLDPDAKLQTSGYHTYPIFPNTENNSHGKKTQPIRWRVSESLNVTTPHLKKLPKTVAAVQAVVSLNGISFGLSETTSKTIDQEKIAAAYHHLSQRIATIANAIGRNKTDATIQSIEFDVNDHDSHPTYRLMAAPAAGIAREKQAIEPDFEPGETIARMRITSTILFK